MSLWNVVVQFNKSYGIERMNREDSNDQQTARSSLQTRLIQNRLFKFFIILIRSLLRLLSFSLMRIYLILGAVPK